MKKIIVTESELINLIKKVVSEAVGPEPILDKKTKIFGKFGFGEGKTKPMSLNGKPVTQADIDYLVKDMSMYIKNTGTLQTLETFGRTEGGSSNNTNIPKFISLNLFTSHTGSGEENSNVAQGRLNFLSGMVMKAFDLLGVDTSIARSVIITNSDTSYSPTSLNKNFYDPKKLKPEDIERFGHIEVTSLVTKGNKTGGIQQIQRGLNSASSDFNNIFVDGVNETAVVNFIKRLQTFSDITDLSDSINAGGKFKNLQAFLNDQLFDDEQEMKAVASHLKKLAAQSNKQMDTIRLFKNAVGFEISIGIGS